MGPSAGHVPCGASGAQSCLFQKHHTGHPAASSSPCPPAKCRTLSWMPGDKASALPLASADTVNTDTLRGADTCAERKAGRGGAAGTGGLRARGPSKAGPRWTADRPGLVLTSLPPRRLSAASCGPRPRRKPWAAGGPSVCIPVTLPSAGAQPSLSHGPADCSSQRGLVPPRFQPTGIGCLSSAAKVLA